MALTVTTKILTESQNERTVILTGIGTATEEETNVVKVDKSTLTLAGAEPAAIDILSISAAIQGFTYIKLSFDNTSDETIVVLPSGTFYEEFGRDNQEGRGRYKNSGDNTPGDILLTTVGGDLNDTYTIVLRIRLR